jgi:hypothetical protein
MAGLMLKAALHRFGRLGFVGALLLALATVALPLESQACAPVGADAVAMTVATAPNVQTDPCESDDCNDCAAACAQACCHAPQLGILAPMTALMTPAAIARPLAMPEPLTSPLAKVSALERPPRA